jgi:dolichol-phosphate mannosyltransferase
MDNPLELQIIVPLYNEAGLIVEFHKRLVNVLDTLPYGYTILYVDDGSNDETYPKLISIANQDERVCLIQLSRNFGHQAALAAGLDQVEGKMIITMDGDGQHSPELIPLMIEKHLEGYDIVQTKRNDDKTPFMKRITAKYFYWLINVLGDTAILPGTADFRLYGHNVVMALRQITEYHKFIRGMIPWLGFTTIILPYTPQQRISGKSKYTLKKMFGLAENAIFSFSLVPLKFSLFIGFFFLFLALIEAIYVLSFWFRGQQDLLAPGWSSLVFLILVTGGVLMIMLGIIGVYIGHIHQEVKNRPLYIIKSKYQNNH